MKFSILICSLESRKHLLVDLMCHLYLQISHAESENEIEVLECTDNKQFTTGKKRQQLLESAKGKYIIFIDDDDEIYPYYIAELLKAYESNADCFAINGHYSVDGGAKQRWELSKDNADHDANGILYRRTNHITAVKRELALLAGFPDKSNAEDKAYSEALNPHLKTEYKIESPMYHYRYSSHNKEYV